MMPLSVVAKAEMVQLVDDLQEGVLSEPQLARLNQLLAVSEECRREYICWTVMYTAFGRSKRSRTKTSRQPPASSCRKSAGDEGKIRV